VTPAWWQALCREWVDPRLSEHATRHPPRTSARARALIGRAADVPAAAAVLAGLTPTLVHGDVHPGNIVAGAGPATLIDWGGCRVGPAALDLANVVTAGSAEVARYARTWQQHAGRPLPGDAIERGYRWAALQIPVQYLPWIAGHQSTSEVEACLDRIERALAELREA
jgi:Ser/Thr protein kinase RdoA (MazF antagonist)